MAGTRPGGRRLPGRGSLGDMSLSAQLDEAARAPFKKKCKPSKRGSPVATPDELDAAGNCYEQAAEPMVMPFGSHKNWDLVHGRPTLQRPPFIEFGHAWLEKGGQVYDPSTGSTMSRSVYYDLGQINHEHNLVYTSAQARRFIMAHGHWGPWEGVDAPPASAAVKKELVALKTKRTKKSTKP